MITGSDRHLLIVYKFEVFIELTESDSFTNYNYVGNTKVSVSIKTKLMPTNAH